MPRLAFAIAAACALSMPAAATEWPVCHGGNRAARHVTCVVDDDTWWRDGVKYRLACVDALEIDDMRGIEARDELRRLLSRTDARVRDLGIEDRYRRSLAMIAVGDTTTGRILVSKGLAERKDYRDTRNWCHRL
ncbi:MAG: thermonuclease family protein [Rhizobiaceae bacterium]